MTVTAQDLITYALRLIGVVASQETPAPEDLDDGLITLNQMLADWNTQHLTIYTVVNRTKALSAGVGSYTFGTGGSIDHPRPVKIESAGVIQSNGLRDVLDIVTSKEWAAIPEKGLTGVRPMKLYSDDDYPLTTIYIWPKPSGTPTLDLYVWESLSDSLVLTDPIDLPPGFLKAMRYNLAVDLAPEYGREPSQAILGIAMASKNALFALNRSNDLATDDPPPPPQQIAQQ